MLRYRAVEEPRRISAPEGKVYSTNPEVVLVEGASSFVVKGPDPRIVFPEAASYELANLLGIPVPGHGSCAIPSRDGVFFCCRKLRGRFPIDFWLDQDLAANPEAVPHTIVFDVWIGNYDRNIGNFVEDEPDAPDSGLVKLFAIDFEKAAVLRGEPDRFTLTAWDSKRFWPTGDLGNVCRRFEEPLDFCDRIASVDVNVVASILHRVRMDLDLMSVPWLDSATDVLRKRARDIRRLVQEAWYG